MKSGTNGFLCGTAAVVLTLGACSPKDRSAADSAADTTANRVGAAADTAASRVGAAADTAASTGQLRRQSPDPAAHRWRGGSSTDASSASCTQ
jgi:hypothetical protein